MLPISTLCFIDLTWIDVIDILLVAILFYQLHKLLKGTTAVYIFIGILLFYVLWLLVESLNMRLFGSILGKFIDVGFIALLIVFQQEIRRFLIYIGTSDIISAEKLKKNLLEFKFYETGKKHLDINSIIKACKNMSATKTGALIILTRKNDLNFYVKTGDKLDAILSSRMLENIFYKNSPLHDGAVIISRNKIVAARCVLPVTENSDFPAHLGMRHRAAMGITETTDAIAIIVSEQTGEISYCKEGILKHSLPIEKLKEKLEKDFN